MGTSSLESGCGGAGLGGVRFGPLARLYSAGSGKSESGDESPHSKVTTGDKRKTPTWEGRRFVLNRRPLLKLHLILGVKEVSISIRRNARRVVVVTRIEM